ncbi:DUF4160 domain-containing protein [uncultured Draconibacterium sp.]|uniref:DUF4160 domain-containing protein n=1 Tax=uncultured Draconibacterium sp. TaxID=1573823 RepID=UPI003217D693
MPKIFEYLGILIFFYSNEHEPIHVHARKGEYESKAEFIIQNGAITEIRIQQVKGISPLMNNEMKLFKDFLEIYADKIVQKWIDYFILHKDVEFERITKKIK